MGIEESPFLATPDLADCPGHNSHKVRFWQAIERVTQLMEATGKWRLHGVVKAPGEANHPSGEKSGELEALIAAWREYVEDVGVTCTNCCPYATYTGRSRVAPRRRF